MIILNHIVILICLVHLVLHFTRRDILTFREVMALAHLAGVGLILLRTVGYFNLRILTGILFLCRGDLFPDTGRLLFI